MNLRKNNFLQEKRLEIENLKFNERNFDNHSFVSYKWLSKFQTLLFVLCSKTKAVSYNRFTELMQSNMLPLCLYMKTCCLGKCTGISFIDSTPVRVCNKKRISKNQVFKDIATIGKSTMGWFYGFKLHIIVNDKGELLEFVITQANVDDRAPLNFLAKIFGKLYADKGYVSKELIYCLIKDYI